MQKQQQIKQTRKPPNPCKRVRVWKTLNVFVALAPLIALATVNWKHYFEMATNKTFTNVVGFASLSVFIGAIVIKKTSFLKGVWGFLLVSLILECLHFIIQDIRIISWAATFGMAVSHFWTNPKVLKWETIRDKKESALITAEANAKVFEKAFEKTTSVRSGRV